MTRKDYVRLADAIREARRIIDATCADERSKMMALRGADAVTGEIARALKSENGAFDRERFMAHISLDS